jgi:RimJ/RimL family protein N-acetyltransferase
MGIFLETKRLILKTTELSDLDMLIALRSDFEVMKHTGYGVTQTKEQVKEYLDFAISYQEKHGMGFCLVFEKKAGALSGKLVYFICCLMIRNQKLNSIIICIKSFGGKAMVLN